MKLAGMRIKGFQSFGIEPTSIDFEDLTFLLGPNGAGKTATMQALLRLFAFDRNQRRIQPSDFFVPWDEAEAPGVRTLWIEADFLFPELAVGEDAATVPPHFGHMRLDDVNGVPRVRYRLTATLDAEGEVDESLCYVLETDGDGEPVNPELVSRSERSHIAVHYLPARRDPADHISYAANSLLGKVLRSINWGADQATVRELTSQITAQLTGNPGVSALSNVLAETWSRLHVGQFFSSPSLTFDAADIQALLRHLTITFAPGHAEHAVNYARLSDGQKSMLYLSLVLAVQAAVQRAIDSDEEPAFDLDKLKPPVFTLIAMEEPENSLSPHYLGRIISAIRNLSESGRTQGLIATHSPSILKRVAPEAIRYLRLTSRRQTKVTKIVLPDEGDEAHKYVREAIQAFPELYFSRLVILGEGDSEEIVLPRILMVKGAEVDQASISIAPLGGRHVNHFWRLLTALEIPHLTLLDLDLARNQGGWGRIKYAAKQLRAYNSNSGIEEQHINNVPAWNDAANRLARTHDWLPFLERNGVYFSAPLDLDFSMLKAFPVAYGVEPADQTEPDVDTLKAVLGKSHFGPDQYDADERKLFLTYHKRFKLGSKPASHLDAMTGISDADLLARAPESLVRLADAAIAKLEALPE